MLSSSAVAFLASCAQADKTAMEVCIRRNRKMGVSADLAFRECKRQSLVECIKQLKIQRPVYKATSKTEQGYVIDLGDDKKAWKEGKFWKDRGCKVNKRGDHITRDMNDKQGFLQRYRWFRQAWCSTETIEGLPLGDKLAYKECVPAGYLATPGFNTPDSIKSRQLMDQKNGGFLVR